MHDLMGAIAIQTTTLINFKTMVNHILLKFASFCMYNFY